MTREELERNLAAVSATGQQTPVPLAGVPMAAPIHNPNVSEEMPAPTPPSPAPPVPDAKGKDERSPWEKMTGAQRGAAVFDIFNKLGKSFSDERAKTHVDSGNTATDSFLGALKPYSYEYKEGLGAPPGRHTSVMAQDLEKSEAGRQAVVERPDGIKMVDYGKVAPAMLAGLARVNERLEAVEKKSKGK